MHGRVGRLKAMGPPRVDPVRHSLEYALRLGRNHDFLFDLYSFHDRLLLYLGLFGCSLELDQRRRPVRRKLTDPALIDVTQWYGVEIMPFLAPSLPDEYELSFFQDLKMLHDREARKLRSKRDAESSCRLPFISQHIQ